MIARGDFAEEFFEKYPRCFPLRRVPRARRRWKERWLSWQWRRFRAFLADLFFGPILTRIPICGAGCGVGWWPILHRLFADLEVLSDDPGCEWFRVDQVKEKFGGLRVYLGCETEEMTKRIREAEDEAYRTCEYCGKPGEPRRGGWVKTLCDECDGGDA